MIFIDACFGFSDRRLFAPPDKVALLPPVMLKQLAATIQQLLTRSQEEELEGGKNSLKSGKVIGYGLMVRYAISRA
jgi:hypothetical protein